MVYIGNADKLRNRISQDLVRRDSSIVTGISIMSMNPDVCDSSNVEGVPGLLLRDKIVMKYPPEQPVSDPCDRNPCRN